MRFAVTRCPNKMIPWPRTTITAGIPWPFSFGVASPLQSATRGRHIVANAPPRFHHHHYLAPIRPMLHLASPLRTTTSTSLITNQLVTYSPFRLRGTSSTRWTQLSCQRRFVSGFFDKNYHNKKRGFWKQLKSIRKSPGTLALLAAVGLGVPAFAIGYGYYYQDIVPHSGRRRVMDVSEEEEIRMGLAAFHYIKQTYKDKILPDDHRHVKAVRRVGQKIIKESGLTDLHWEFLVVESEETNAFVLPGGKVCVFTGILPIMKDEDGLATVLGHEIGHVVARHGAEKWSKAKWYRILGWLTAWLFAKDEPGFIINAFMTLLLSLPFSRMCESEADYIGLMLLARACYDPTKALELWDRFAQVHNNSIKYLSTHPSPKDRIKKLQQWMPEAIEQRHDHCGRHHPSN